MGKEVSLESYFLFSACFQEMVSDLPKNLSRDSSQGFKFVRDTIEDLCKKVIFFFISSSRDWASRQSAAESFSPDFESI